MVFSLCLLLLTFHDLFCSFLSFLPSFAFQPCVYDGILFTASCFFFSFRNSASCFQPRQPNQPTKSADPNKELNQSNLNQSKITNIQECCHVVAQYLVKISQAERCVMVVLERKLSLTSLANTSDVTTGSWPVCWGPIEDFGFSADSHGAEDVWVSRYHKYTEIL